MSSNERDPNTNPKLALACALILTVLIGGEVWAAGGAPSAPPPPAIPQDPAMVAKTHYNNGVRLREKAAKLEEKLAAAPAAKRAKLEERIARTYEEATQEYSRAVSMDRGLYQAFSDLGYVLRKQGDYEQALAAYDLALQIEPGYAEAIEYRGEAYLGLGRIDDAKAAYLKLFADDRARADELMTAMKTWLEERREDPGSVDRAALDAFADWLAEREQIASFVPRRDDQRVARAW